MQITRKRCAIYTRKSVEEGLDMEFNTLDAQRQAGESYIASQSSNGWICLPERYDDGGFSGGTLERPALTKLLDDAEKGLVDVIVIYKLDRLSRSIMDFAELSRKFDDWGVSFCCVTQEINTSTSSGRMMLNILMTFAQYEREIIAERIKDKMSASRKRGQWVGGTVPYGYKAENKHLIIDEDTEQIAKSIFENFCQYGSARKVAIELNQQGILTNRNKSWTTQTIYSILKNHTYVGEVNYKGEIYQGEHKGIINKAVWEEAQKILKDNAPNQENSNRREIIPPLQGIIRCGHCNSSMSQVHSKRHGKYYTYYQCVKDTKRDISICPIKRLVAGEIEKAVIEQIGLLFRQPSFISIISRMLGDSIEKIMDEFNNINGFWEELFPAEQNRLMKLLVENITVYETGLEIKIKTTGMRGLIKELEYAND